MVAKLRARQRGRQRLGGATVALSKVQSVDQRMRLECGVGFRQLRTCRRIRPGQLCANNGRERVQQWMHQKAGYWITSSARASLAAAPAIAVEIAAARKSAVRRQSGPRGKRRLTVLRHWRSPKETGYAALRTANMGSAPSMPFGNVPGMNNRLLSAVA